MLLVGLSQGLSDDRHPAVSTHYEQKAVRASARHKPQPESLKVKQRVTEVTQVKLPSFTPLCMALLSALLCCLTMLAHLGQAKANHVIQTGQVDASSIKKSV